ncbi:hypothetical protein HD554DRAFT_2329465 [Boletus coccyginus]|nr:hypothetical protein HD554DRAFT_2329465 [Boletus coccyginus]
MIGLLVRSSPRCKEHVKKGTATKVLRGYKIREIFRGASGEVNKNTVTTGGAKESNREKEGPSMTNGVRFSKNTFSMSIYPTACLDPVVSQLQKYGEHGGSHIGGTDGLGSWNLTRSDGLGFCSLLGVSASGLYALKVFLAVHVSILWHQRFEDVILVTVRIFKFLPFPAKGPVEGPATSRGATYDTDSIFGGRGISFLHQFPDPGRLTARMGNDRASISGPSDDQLMT